MNERTNERTSLTNNTVKVS